MQRTIQLGKGVFHLHLFRWSDIPAMLAYVAGIVVSLVSFFNNNMYNRKLRVGANETH